MNCPGCDKPLIEGQAMNGLLKCHWDCQDATREKMGSQNADDLMQFRINQRLAMEGIFPGSSRFERLGGRIVK